jgi:hypothetical protein
MIAEKAAELILAPSGHRAPASAGAARQALVE